MNRAGSIVAILALTAVVSYWLGTADALFFPVIAFLVVRGIGGAVFWTLFGAVNGSVLFGTLYFVEIRRCNAAGERIDDGPFPGLLSTCFGLIVGTIVGALYGIFRRRGRECDQLVPRDEWN